MEKQEVMERYNTYKSDPNAWLWLKERGADKEFDPWARVAADHFEKNLMVRLKNSNEKLVELFQAQFLWGQDTGYRSGISNGRVYQVKYGTFATGYLCLTSENLYIIAFAELTKKYPLMKQPGFISAVLLGVLGERDEREPYQKDGFWSIPLKTIQDAQITAPEENVECVILTTGSTSWNLHVADDLPFTLTAINMARFGQLENTNTSHDTQTVQPKSTDDHMAKLQQLKDLLNANLITQSEYDAKKQEILSRL